MGNFLAWWIAIQLFVIGGTLGMQRHEVYLGTYNCHDDHSGDEIMGSLFPLLAFVPADQTIEKYCEGKR